MSTPAASDSTHAHADCLRAELDTLSAKIDQIQAGLVLLLPHSVSLSSLPACAQNLLNPAMLDIYSEDDDDAVPASSRELAVARDSGIWCTDSEEPSLATQPMVTCLLPSVGTALRPPSHFPLLAHAMELEAREDPHGITAQLCGDWRALPAAAWARLHEPFPRQPRLCGNWIDEYGNKYTITDCHIIKHWDDGEIRIAMHISGFEKRFHADYSPRSCSILFAEDIWRRDSSGG